MLTLHSFLFFLAILLSSSERDKTEALRSLGRDNKELLVNNQGRRKRCREKYNHKVILI